MLFFLTTTNHFGCKLETQIHHLVINREHMHTLHMYTLQEEDGFIAGKSPMLARRNPVHTH